MWSRFLSRRRPAVGPRPATRQLRLEQLEDRLTPSASFAASVGVLLPDSGQGVGTDVHGNVYVAGNRVGTITDIDTDGYVGKYDADGVPQWSKVLSGYDTLGNSFGDSANAISVDADGNSYVAGSFRATVDFGNGIVLTSTGAIDGFVAKYDTDGNVQWAHQFASNGNFGPSLYDRLGTRAPKGIALDHSGNVLVTGYFYRHMDMDYLANPGLHTLDSSAFPNDNGSSYVVKLDGDDGNFVWQAQADGVGGATAFSVAVDGQDNVYTLGGTGDHAWFNDKNANSLPLFDDSNRDVLYVWKLTSDGLNVRVTQLDKCADTVSIFGLGIAVDAVGNTYATGAFSGTGFDFDLSVSQAGDTISSDGGHDVFIAKLDNFGHYQWVRKAGGVGDDWGTGIALDPLGHPYVTGYVTDDSLFGNQLLTPVSPDGNSFITELDADGNFLCTHKSEDTGNPFDGDRAAAITVDGDGFVDVTGSFTGSMQLNGLSPPLSVGSTDQFVVKTKLDCSPIQLHMLDEHTLQLLGTNQGDRVYFTNDLQLGLLVALDNEAPRVLGFGVLAIEGQMRGGDDLVDGQFSSGGISPVPDIRVDFGNGADRFAVQGRLEMAEPPAGRVWHIDLSMGAGNDSVRSDIQSSMALAMTADLGLGADVFNAIWTHWVTSIASPEQLTVRGGAGADDVQVRYAYGLDPDVPTTASIDANFIVAIDGDEGDDSVLVDYDAQSYEPSQPGDPPLVIDVPLMTSINGGAGNDDVRVTHGFNPQPEPPGWPGVVITGAISDVIDGGAGNDTMIIIINSNPVPGGAMTTINAPVTILARGSSGADVVEVDFNQLTLDAPLVATLDGGDGADHLVANVAWQVGAGGQTTINLLGGRGADEVEGMAGNHIAAGGRSFYNLDGGDGADRLFFDYDGARVDGEFHLNMDGGDGRDTLEARLEFDPRSLGRAYAQARGGQGNDDLTMEVFGAENLAFLDALIDGGVGLDTAHHTPNVRALDCER